MMNGFNPMTLCEVRDFVSIQNGGQNLKTNFMYLFTCTDCCELYSNLLVFIRMK